MTNLSSIQSKKNDSKLSQAEQNQGGWLSRVVKYLFGSSSGVRASNAKTDIISPKSSILQSRKMGITTSKLSSVSNLIKSAGENFYIHGNIRQELSSMYKGLDQKAEENAKNSFAKQTGKSKEDFEDLEIDKQNNWVASAKQQLIEKEVLNLGHNGISSLYEAMFGKKPETVHPDSPQAKPYQEIADALIAVAQDEMLIDEYESSYVTREINSQSNANIGGAVIEEPPLEPPPPPVDSNVSSAIRFLNQGVPIGDKLIDSKLSVFESAVEGDLRSAYQDEVRKLPEDRLDEVLARMVDSLEPREGRLTLNIKGGGKSAGLDQEAFLERRVSVDFFSDSVSSVKDAMERSFQRIGKLSDYFVDSERNSYLKNDKGLLIKSLRGFDKKLNSLSEDILSAENKDKLLGQSKQLRAQLREDYAALQKSPTEENKANLLKTLQSVYKFQEELQTLAASAQNKIQDDKFTQFSGGELSFGEIDYRKDMPIDSKINYIVNVLLSNQLIGCLSALDKTIGDAYEQLKNATLLKDSEWESTSNSIQDDLDKTLGQLLKLSDDIVSSDQKEQIESQVNKMKETIEAAYRKLRRGVTEDGLQALPIVLKEVKDFLVDTRELLASVD